MTGGEASSGAAPAAPAPGRVQVEALARVLGLTARRVQQLAKEGVFPKAERGWYLLVPCIQAYIKFWQDRATAPERDAGSKSALLDAKTRIARASAERTEAENLVFLRSLIPAEAHFGVVEALLIALSDQLKSLPQRWRPFLEGRGGPALLAALTDLVDEEREALRAAVLAAPLYEAPVDPAAPAEPGAPDSAAEKVAEDS